MVGKSKVISGLSTHQAFRRRKDTVMGSSIGPDTHAKFNEPKGTIGEQFQPTLFAPLIYNSDAVLPGGNFLPATFSRATSATYWDKNNTLQIAETNESRHEFQSGNPIGLSMENDGTNLFFNSAAPATQNINLGTGDYTFQVVGTGSLTSANAGGTATGHGTATQGTPVTISVTAAGEISFTVAGSLDYAQVEAGNIETSIILTQDAAGSRSADIFSYPLTGQVNQSAGMAAITWRSRAQDSQIPNITQTFLILRIDNPAAAMLFYRKESNGDNFFISRNDAGAAQDRRIQIVAGLEKNKDYLIMLRWGSGNNQVGYKVDGTVRWSTTGTFTGLSGDVLQIAYYFASSLDMPSWNRNLYLWDEDKGTAWLESFFSGTSN